MDKSHLKSLGLYGCHQCAPRGWRDTPIITADYDLDQTIMHRSNKDLPNRLQMYVKRASYGKRTGYSGYRGTDD
jgi:hypothetical protein